MTATPYGRTEMAARVAADIPEGWWVNLGIGIPTLVADHVPLEREVVFHSENGVLGMGPAPAPEDVNPWLINAGKQHVTLRQGGSYVHQADSFAMIRGGHLDLCVLGAFEVAENGDVANWSRSDNDFAPAVGGAMDLAVGAKRLWAVMEHTTKEGAPRLVRRCSYPLTALAAVEPDLHQPGRAGRDRAGVRRPRHGARPRPGRPTGRDRSRAAPARVS